TEGAGAPLGAFGLPLPPFGGGHLAALQPAISDPGAATSGRSETLWPATKRLPPAFDGAFPRRSDARPASLRRWVLLPTDGYLGPPDPVFAKHDSGRRPCPTFRTPHERAPHRARLVGIYTLCKICQGSKRKTPARTPGFWIKNPDLCFVLAG